MRFALDDVGTGCPSRIHLKRIPPDMPRIDRSFIQNMLAERRDLAIVEGVISLGKTQRGTVVAEGLESAAHAQRLTEAGCFVGQCNGVA